MVVTTDIKEKLLAEMRAADILYFATNDGMFHRVPAEQARLFHPSFRKPISLNPLGIDLSKVERVIFDVFCPSDWDRRYYLFELNEVTFEDGVYHSHNGHKLAFSPKVILSHPQSTRAVDWSIWEVLPLSCYFGVERQPVCSSCGGAGPHFRLKTTVNLSFAKNASPQTANSERTILSHGENQLCLKNSNQS